MIIKERPDLVLLDILLPKKDGIAILKELREGVWGKNVPVLVLTNLSSNQDIAEAAARGSTAYLIKNNWTLEDLVKKVKETFNN